MIKIICDKCNQVKKPEEVIVVESHICKDCMDKLQQEAVKK